MPTQKIQIKIEGILGGHSPASHFSADTQFKTSLGINPGLPDSDEREAPSGLIRPAGTEKFSGATIAKAPLWLVDNPKNTNVYVHDSQGSAYTIDSSLAVAALSDAGTLSNGKGNGSAYYDNYIYYALNTTVARYGPLDGTPGFVPDYWVSTLSLTALENTTYPKEALSNTIEYPNHILHRHSDGRLYILDVVGNQGTIHFIQTKKTSVEGDTDDGSTYAAVQVGYGLWPTAVESWDINLVIGFIEGAGSAAVKTKAKIAFWDTTSTNVNQIVWVEFPDQFISAIKNINGVLYVVSGSAGIENGFRISRYVGGYSFEEVWRSYDGIPCFPGAVDGIGTMLALGSYCKIPEASGCAFGFNLPNPQLNTGGFFNLMKATGTADSTVVTALRAAESDVNEAIRVPMLGWYDASTAAGGLDKSGTTYNTSVFRSQVYRIGQPFKVTKVRLPLAQKIAANMTITPKLVVDDEQDSFTMAAINNTSDSGKYNVIRRSASNGDPMLGQHDFYLEIRITGTALSAISLPILIDVELIDD